MKIQTAQQLLAARNIQATEEQIIQAIAPMSIADITEADIDFLVESLSQQSALAPIAPTNAIAPTKPKTTKGGKLAKTSKKAAAIEPHSTPVNSRHVEVNAAPMTTSQEIVSQLVAQLAGQDQAILSQASDILAALAVSAPERTLAMTSAKIAQMSVGNPIDSVVSQYQESGNAMLRSIAQTINASNAANGIAGMGFDVEIEE